jgi:hypothetical protein
MGCNSDCLDCENQECEEDKAAYLGPFVVSWNNKVYHVSVKGNKFRYATDSSKTPVEYFESELDSAFVAKVRKMMVSEIVCSLCGNKADKGKKCWWCETKN